MSKIILIDAGHGIDTAGKRSPKWEDGTQLFEWEFNRKLTNLIVAGCEKNGIRAIKIVPETADVPLSERCQRVNRWAKNEDCILFSIHANAGGGTGFEVFTSVGVTESDKVASALISQFQKDFPEIKIRTDYSDGDADKEAGFYVLKHTICPAILVENLFMDYEPDCRLLLNESFCAKLATSYVECIKSIAR